MVSPQLLDYIRQQLAAGVSKEEIIQALVTTGWQGQDINDAFSTIGTQSAPPQIQETPVATIVQSTVTQNDSPHGRKRWSVILITIIALILLGGGAVFAFYTLRTTPSEPTITNQATSSPPNAADVYYAQETFTTAASSTLNNIPSVTSATWSFYAYDPQTTETKKVASLETNEAAANAIDADQLAFVDSIPAVAILTRNRKEVDLLNLITGKSSILFTDNLATTTSRDNTIQGVAVSNDGKSILVDTFYLCENWYCPAATGGYIPDEAFLFTEQGDGSFKQVKELPLSDQSAQSELIQPMLVNDAQFIDIYPGKEGGVPGFLDDVDLHSGKSLLSSTAPIVGGYVINGAGTEVAFVGENSSAEDESCLIDISPPAQADNKIQILDVATGKIRVAYQVSDPLKGFEPIAFSADGNSLLFSETEKRSMGRGLSATSGQAADCIIDTPYFYPDIAPHYNLNLQTGSVTPVSDIAQWAEENNTTVEETAYDSATTTSTMLLVNGKVAASLTGNSQSLIIWNSGANLIR